MENANKLGGAAENRGPNLDSVANVRSDYDSVCAANFVSDTAILASSLYMDNILTA